MDEEREVLESIYGDEFSVLSTGSGSEVWRVVLDGHPLVFHLPDGYPHKARPVVNVGAGGQRWPAAVLSAMEEDVPLTGEGLIFEMVEWLRERAADNDGAEAGGGGDGDDERLRADETEAEATADGGDDGAVALSVEEELAQAEAELAARLQIKADAEDERSRGDGAPRTVLSVGPVLTDRKSKFQSFACRVTSVAQVDAVHAELLSDKRIAASTHNMFAYRIQDADSGEMIEWRDDDGEGGAGDKLLSLLQLTNRVNVFVMCTRWYGGVHLGHMRFRHIVNNAKDALELMEEA